MLEKLILMINLALFILILYLVRNSRRDQRKSNNSSREIRTSLKELKSQSRQNYWQMEKYIQLSKLLDFNEPIPNLRSWTTSPDILLELHKIAKSATPLKVLDLGSGVSTLVLALTCPNAEIISIDHSLEYAEKTRELLAAHGVLNVDLRVAPLIAHPQGVDWYDTSFLADIRDLDLLFIDGPPGSKNDLARNPALIELVKKLSLRAYVILDDTNRSGERELANQFSANLPSHKLEFLNFEKGAAVLKPN